MERVTADRAFMLGGRQSYKDPAFLSHQQSVNALTNSMTRYWGQQ